MPCQNSIFRIIIDEINDPKRPRKYNLHYDDERGDVLRSSHIITLAAVKINF